MKPLVLVDTGPLVAMLNRRDQFHAWTIARLAEIEPPLLTCEAVLSEACFLLRRAPGGAVALLTLVEQGHVRVALELGSEAGALKRLLEKYADVPMSLADSCLVRLSELHPSGRLLTLDSDFARYRRRGKDLIPLIHPSL
jgi:predicted nucleic acid-binding protein